MDCYSRALSGELAVEEFQRYAFAYMYRKPLDVYPYLRCGHGATLPTARLIRHGDDFLHEGVGCLPVAQVTVASDANKVRL